LAGVTVFLLSPARAQQTNAPLARAEQICREARADYESHSNRVESACNLARACFDLAEFPEEDAARTALGREGMAAARHALSMQPTNAAAHYYLALNMGEIARTKRMSGLKLVAEMEEEFEIARSLDEKLDYAGPDRCLGLLYRDAPGWPLSIGSRADARKHLLRAVDLGPDYPENWINLIESCLEWGDASHASQNAVSLRELWPRAKSKLTGPPWEASWNDWDDRWDKIQKKLAEKTKPPRHK
jgi:hypothetical protein